MEKKVKPSRPAGAPSPMQFLLVIVATALLIAISWIGYFRFGWFQ